MTPRQLVERGTIPGGSTAGIAGLSDAPTEPTFSPPPTDAAQTIRPRITNHP